ncbi:type II toxin-antitoxin system HipA family toxin [Neptunicella marina]|uniref:Type II toxin-antitoxin system HipA family toxin n=1 Tax=Neptunicella marina TaxID=2125989 RepID=A0A8J6IUY6_9ALTE|nr:type II toxin-antitoxin system HipA family toxin [Neptunicella marina]MBC3766382.1 type II toxin-antitoxin system HipA family toxin [Neptunicella marina]
MTSKAYVFIDGLEDAPIVCGVIQIDEATKKGRFRYGKSYLNRPNAFALDPVNLPLTDQEHSTQFNQGLFGVLSDAGADSWGKKIILSLHSTKPKNALEFLLAGSGMGVGALVFSLSSTNSKPKYNKNTLGDLPMLLKAKDAILADEDISPEAKKAFEYGSSMGGARPKTIVQDGDITYLAKFNRPDDIINIVKVEHAAMRMLDELPCRVATTKVQTTPNGDVLLVERFDLHKGKPNCHYLSANSVFSQNKVNSAVLSTTYSYGQLAEFIMKNGAEPTDAHDLYYRMVFNVLMGNTDDHSRNHALLYPFDQAHWRLSPAFDVLPVNNSQMHGIGIGINGREGNVANLLSQSLRFGLKTFKAQKIIEDVRQLTQEWQYYFEQHGVGSADIERLKAIIPNIQA